MLIDLILDRRAGDAYNAKELYDYCQDAVFEFYHKVAAAMDGGSEDEVKKLLCDYITLEMYNPKICDYINSVNWIE